MNKTDITNIRDTIITEALPEIAFDGWQWETIEKAAAQKGYNTNTVRSVFPGQMMDALDHFAVLADREMLKALENITPDDLRIRDRIQTALMARYTWLAQNKEAYRQSLQFWLHPMRKARAAKITWRTGDHIWTWAGDTATDYNHYTKRALLSGIIASSALAFLNDPTENLEKTQSFVDRRIENVMQLGGLINKLKKRP